MKLSTALLALTIGLMTSNVMAANYSLQEVSVDYSDFDNSQNQAKTTALNLAMKQLEKTCIDKQWGSSDQIDVINVKDFRSMDPATAYRVYLKVEAVCRSL